MIHTRLAACATTCAVLLGLGTAGPGAAAFQTTDNYYVIVSSDTTRAEAEARTSAGTWVLDTNLYPRLSPNLYAVVRGPYPDLPMAEGVLDFARRSHPDAYIRNAGPPDIGQDEPRALVAAVLGTVEVDVTREPGGRHGCEPQEPYAVIAALGAAEFHVITRTGELRPPIPCAMASYREYLSQLDPTDPYAVSGARAYFRWHFRSAGHANLNDSAVVEFRALHEAVLAIVDDSPAPPLPEDPNAPEWQRLLDNGFTVGTPGRATPGFSRGRKILDDPEYLPTVFADHVTDGMGEYLRIRREERRAWVRRGPYRFGLGHPLIAWEEFLAAHPDFIWRGEAASYYRDHLKRYLVGDYRGAPYFNIEDGTVETADAYRRFVELYPNTATAGLISRYYAVIVAGDFKCTPALEHFLHGINLAELPIGGRPVFPRDAREAVLFPYENFGGAVYIECSPDENGNVLREGTLPDGRRYTVEEGPQGDDRVNRKAWLVCYPPTPGDEPRRSPLLQYSMYRGDLAPWAASLSVMQIVEWAERYCGG